ncbi:MAG: alpha-amylase family glycosyl hydrolase [Elusimicrobiota bacterium]|jgi:glycosidase
MKVSILRRLSAAAIVAALLLEQQGLGFAKTVAVANLPRQSASSLQFVVGRAAAGATMSAPGAVQLNVLTGSLSAPLTPAPRPDMNSFWVKASGRPSAPAAQLADELPRSGQPQPTAGAPIVPAAAPIQSSALDTPALDAEAGAAPKLSPTGVDRYLSGLGSRLRQPFGSDHREYASEFTGVDSNPWNESASGIRRAAAAGSSSDRKIPVGSSGSQAESSRLPPPEQWDPLIEPPAGTPSSLADISVELEPGREYYPSPADWRNEVIYQTIVDRFARGQGALPTGDQNNGRSRHGGNLKGIIDRLDYIQGMGVTTLLLTPVVMNAPGGYHGYWPIHLLAVDPHYGSMEDFQRLVAEAHKRGMRVVLDFVMDHAGAVFEYKNDPRWVEKGMPSKDVEWRDYAIRPDELSQPEHFYRRGVIDNWDNPEQILYADFPPNLRHYNVGNPATQDMLIRVAQWWMKQTDIDGFRLDAYKHNHPDFWQRFHREVRDYAGKMGKDNFMQLGEISSGIEGEVAPHVGAGKLDSAFNYPAFRNDDAALHAERPTRMLEDGFLRNRAAFGDLMGRMVRFLDNQDSFRFLGQNVPTTLLKVALGYLMFSTGIPMVYYGTEQAFRHIGEMHHYDPGSRGDMFAEGQYKSPGTEGDMFQTGSLLYKWIQDLVAIRQSSAPLRLGSQWVRWSSPYGPGIFAFSRIHEGEEILVVMNTANEPRSADMWIDGGISPPGTDLQDRLDPAYAVRSSAGAEGGSRVAVSIPAHGLRVLTRPLPAADKKS